MELKGQRTFCNTDFLCLHNLGPATAGLAAQFHLAYEFNSFFLPTCFGYQNKSSDKSPKKSSDYSYC